MAAADYTSVVQQLYVSYFGRPADYFGLKNYAEQLDAMGAPTTIAGLDAAVQAKTSPALNALVNSFSPAPVPNAAPMTELEISQFVSSVFENVLHRQPTLGGAQFWIDAIKTGALTMPNASLAITAAALANTTPQGVLDAALVTATNAVATAFTDSMDTPAEINAFKGAAAVAASNALLLDVTATTTVASYQATIDATIAGLVDGANVGTSLTLTTGLDDKTGGAANDTFVALIDNANAANSTLNALDTINGGQGTDAMTLNIVDDYLDAGLPAGVTLSSIETINVRGSGNIGDTAGDFNVSAVAGLTALNVTLAGDVYAKAATTTNVGVSGAVGAVDIQGGKDVTVSVATADQAIKVSTGAATGNAVGAISVTDSAQGTGVITVDGGTTVTVSATSDDGSGNIEVGANKAATGAVVVTQNINSDGTGGTAGDVTVTGGSTITINANLTNTAVEGGGAVEITAGTYTAEAGTATTAVTITQAAVANDYASEVTTAATVETLAATFGALKAGEAVVIGTALANTAGTALTFTAAKDLTAAQVAAAFASLTSADLQAQGGTVTNGTFSGQLVAGWTSGAVVGNTVTFTATTAGVQDDILVYTDADGAGAAGNDATNDADFSHGNVKTDGAAAVSTAAVDVAADFGDVEVDDNATAASVKTITLNGYSAATLGVTQALDALTTLNLTKGAGTTALTSAVTSLALNLDGMKAASAVTLGATVATLNIATSGAASDVDFTAAGAKTVTIAAGANLDMTGGALGALETVTVTGTGNVKFGDISATATTISASAATGNISAQVDGTKATVTTGSGSDAITVDTQGISKAITLGAGDDSLILTDAAPSTPTAAVSGGNGTDTLVLTAAAADALDGNTNFKSAISSFEHLTISDAIDLTAADVTLNLENLGFNYVTLAVAADAANVAIFDKMATAGTLEFLAGATNGATHQVNVTDALTGLTDVLNLVITNDAAVTVGTVVVDEVETINVKATDVFVDADGDLVDDTDAVHELILSANKVVSVVVTGNDLVLDTDSTVLTSVNASAMLGGIEYTADGAVAGTTVLGGAGVDLLTAFGENDVLKGNGGDDVFHAVDLTKIFGGAGKDTFYVDSMSNLTKVATINDFAAGDIIVLNDLGNALVTATKFYAAGAQYNANTTTDVAGKVNAALVQTAEGEASWFQHNDHTYIVVDGTDNGMAAGASDTYQQGTDLVIELVGTYNLANASFNATSGTLEV